MILTRTRPLFAYDNGRPSVVPQSERTRGFIGSSGCGRRPMYAPDAAAVLGGSVMPASSARASLRAGVFFPRSWARCFRILAAAGAYGWPSRRRRRRCCWSSAQAGVSQPARRYVGIVRGVRAGRGWPSAHGSALLSGARTHRPSAEAPGEDAGRLRPAQLPLGI